MRGLISISRRGWMVPEATTLRTMSRTAGRSVSTTTGLGRDFAHRNHKVAPNTPTMVSAMMTGRTRLLFICSPLFVCQRVHGAHAGGCPGRRQTSQPTHHGQ